MDETYFVDELNELEHSGTPQMYDFDPHGSGRYRQGSGENPNQREWKYSAYQSDAAKFYNEVQALKAKGITSYTDQAKAMGISTTSYKAMISMAKAEREAFQRSNILKLKEHGYSPEKIGEMVGVSQRQVYNVLEGKKSATNQRMNATYDMLKRQVDEKGVIDIGEGVETSLGCSESTMTTAYKKLEKEGYIVKTIHIEQPNNPDHQTAVRILCKDEASMKAAFKDKSLIKTVEEYSPNGGKSYFDMEYPASIDPSRVKIEFNDAKDGVIELRRGVPDLNLGNSHYAQVRIRVGEDKFMKGMALYSDNVPDGYDVIYNCNTSKKPDEVFKDIDKSNPKLPFKAVLSANGQSYYEDKNGDYIFKDGGYVKADKNTPSSENRYSLSAINKLKEEGDWDSYSKSLSSQFVSKQSKEFISERLQTTLAEKQALYDDICEIKNPTIKKYMLDSFADSCDSDAVKLKAAALPRQATKVILPVESLKDGEVFAPTYQDGETLYLVRYPHASVHEIPKLVVNKKNAEAIKNIGLDTVDAIGVNLKTAKQLSGADFDGDTVITIPQMGNMKLISKKPLKGLEDFDHLSEYKIQDIQKNDDDKITDSRYLKKSGVNKEMGVISNLLTDMQLFGATENEVERASKYSMIIIDANKHELDFKRASVELGIPQLHDKYQKQMSPEGKSGAATIISLAKNPTFVPKKTGRWVVNEDGTKTQVGGAKTWVDYKTGEVHEYTKPQYRMTAAFEKGGNAYDLVSAKRNPKELLYAEYANNVVELGRKARRTSLAVQEEKVNKSAKEAYALEIDSINEKLETHRANKPRERQAQLYVNQFMFDRKKQYKRENGEDMPKKQVKKEATVALRDARKRYGANGKDSRIHLTDKEWAAIDSGALGITKTKTILSSMTKEEVAQHVLPKNQAVLSESKQRLIRNYVNNGYSYADIAMKLGISPSTVYKYGKGE